MSVTDSGSSFEGRSQLLGDSRSSNPINNVGMFDRPSVANIIKSPVNITSREANKID